MKYINIALGIFLIVLLTAYTYADDTTVTTTEEPTTTTEEAVPTCNTDEDCKHGKCVNSTCECEAGWITRKGVNCNYQQKKKLVAFLLSFFLGGVGADWFYLASGSLLYIIVGAIKLVVGLIACAVGGISRRCGCVQSDGSNPILFAGLVAIIGIISAASGIWWIVDWVRILLNVFRDGNTVQLQSW